SPEIIALGEEKVFSFLNQDSYLEQFKFPYQKLFRSQKHILDSDKEKIIANFYPIKSIPTSLYQSLSVIDRTDETVTLSTGQTVVVSQAQYRALLENTKDP